jgi:hypothetical protein
MLELVGIWKLGQLAVSLFIHTVRYSKIAFNLVNWEIGHIIWDKDFC